MWKYVCFATISRSTLYSRFIEMYILDDAILECLCSRRYLDSETCCKLRLVSKQFDLHAGKCLESLTEFVFVSLPDTSSFQEWDPDPDACETDDEEAVTAPPMILSKDENMQSEESGLFWHTLETLASFLPFVNKTDGRVEKLKTLLPFWQNLGAVELWLSVDEALAFFPCLACVSDSLSRLENLTVNLVGSLEGKEELLTKSPKMMEYITSLESGDLAPASS